MILFAAMNNLSDVNFVAPYKFIGAQALSVERATTLDTLQSRQVINYFGSLKLLTDCALMNKNKMVYNTKHQAGTVLPCLISVPN